MQCPCKGCNLRGINCHSDCGAYLQWKDEQSKINMRRYEQKRREQEWFDHKKERVLSAMRNK